jgi:hypothetical protein
MCELRIWCHNEATAETFSDTVTIVSALWKDPAELAESVRRLYEHKAPQVEVLRVVQLMRFERELT